MNSQTATLTSLQPHWQSELARSFRQPEQLLAALGIDSIPEQDIAARKLFAMQVPRPFVARMAHGDINDPLFKQVWPQSKEFDEHPGYIDDPLHEHQTTVPGLLHKYDNRALLIVRGGCAVNCRYCFRRHFPYADNRPTGHNWQPALHYLREHPQITEVILSGGDPLMADDAHLAQLLSELAAIPHLQRLRIHTRLPVVLPCRITDALLDMLQRCRLKPVMVVHINHANEIDETLRLQLQRVRQAGIWLLNQSVLLAGINDSADAVAELSEALFTADVQPYYLHLFDPVRGAAHFDVAETQAKAIMRELFTRLPGFLIPRLVRELAGEPSKTPIDLENDPR